MTYEGRTNTASYVTAGIAGADAFTSNLRATKSTDFTRLSNTIADARALQQKALMQGDLKKDLAKMKADALIKEGKKIKELGEDSKPRMAGMLAAFTLNGAGGYLAGAELKKEMNRKSDTSYYDEQWQKAQDSKLPTDDASIKSYLDGVYSEWLEGKDVPTGSGRSSKKDSGGVTEPVTGATLKPSASVTPFGKSPAGKYGQAWYGLSSVIRFAEGTNKSDGYTTMFGHRQFTDMSRHPNSPMATPWGTKSEAAGAYQFMKPTWETVKRNTGVNDFSIESQEIGGRWLTSNRKVDQDKAITTRAEFIQTMDKLAPEWAGLPYSGKGRNGGGYGTSFYGQGGKKVEELIPIYEKAMGYTLK